jgi:hypothetical protein
VIQVARGASPFGAGAALVRTDADLQAKDCFDEDIVTAGCQPINLPGGGARYQSNVPTIIDPAATGLVVRLGSTGETGYNVSFRITVPLGLP